jgi:hypothetical protein
MVRLFMEITRKVADIFATVWRCLRGQMFLLTLADVLSRRTRAGSCAKISTELSRGHSQSQSFLCPKTPSTTCFAVSPMMLTALSPLAMADMKPRASFRVR